MNLWLLKLKVAKSEAWSVIPASVTFDNYQDPCKTLEMKQTLSVLLKKGANTSKRT